MQGSVKKFIPLLVLVAVVIGSFLFIRRLYLTDRTSEIENVLKSTEDELNNSASEEDLNSNSLDDLETSANSAEQTPAAGNPVATEDVDKELNDIEKSLNSVNSGDFDDSGLSGF